MLQWPPQSTLGSLHLGLLFQICQLITLPGGYSAHRTEKLKILSPHKSNLLLDLYQAYTYTRRPTWHHKPGKSILNFFIKHLNCWGLYQAIGPKTLKSNNFKVHVTKTTCGDTSFGRLEKQGTAATCSPWTVLMKHSCAHKDAQKEHVQYNFLGENPQTATENTKVLGYPSKT